MEHLSNWEEIGNPVNNKITLRFPKSSHHQVFRSRILVVAYIRRRERARTLVHELGIVKRTNEHVQSRAQLDSTPIHTRSESGAGILRVHSSLTNMNAHTHTYTRARICREQAHVCTRVYTRIP